MTQDLLTKHEGVRSYMKNLASRKTEEYPGPVSIKRNTPGSPGRFIGVIY